MRYCPKLEVETDHIKIEDVPSPSYVIDMRMLKRNALRLEEIRTRTGATILLALKSFAMRQTFPLLSQYIDGVTASSVNEVRLADETFDGVIHAYSPAYSETDMTEIVKYCNTISFNSYSQWTRYKEMMSAYPKISCGLRINPEYSEVKTPIYNPCYKGSRFGVRASQMPDDLSGISGFHFHALCEQGVDELERTLFVFEKAFSSYFKSLSWINWGGGHHLTSDMYDIDRLSALIIDWQDRYGVEIILEPGEAVVMNAGVLVATVLDIIDNEGKIAILDTSATAHMPDVLEYPYRPEVVGMDVPGAKPYTYRLGGLTCLSGDIIGEYSCDNPLTVGQRLVFKNMAQYTMVKNTMFNGVKLPSLVLQHENGETEIVREFSYDDFKLRLGA